MRRKTTIHLFITLLAAVAMLMMLAGCSAAPGGEEAALASAYIADDEADETLEDPWLIVDEWPEEEDPWLEDGDEDIADEGFLENPSFERFDEEEGYPDAWSVNAWHNDDRTQYGVVEGGVSGQYCAYIFSRGDNDARFEQTVAVEPNTIYRIYAMVKASGVTPEAKGANISVLDILGASNDYHETDGQWREVELVGRTGGDQYTMTILARLGGYGSLASGEAWFDAVGMEKLEDVEGEGIISFDGAGDAMESETISGSDIKGTPYVAFLCILTLLAFYIVYVKCIAQKRPKRWAERELGGSLAVVLFGAFVVRLLLVMTMKGFPNDVACFGGWSMQMAEGGPANFYGSLGFADYPPGYMLILYIPGILREILGISSGSWLFQLLLRMPAIACDLISAYIVFRIAKPRCGNVVTLALTALMAFNPAAAFISGGWGQIDSLLTVLLLATIVLFNAKKKIAATAVYAFAILVKPQALMLGPLLAAAYIAGIWHDEPAAWIRRLFKLSPERGGLRARRLAAAAEALLAVIASVVVILAVSVPFTGNQQGDWLMEKLYSTATSYPCASVNAFNLFALGGGNWVPDTELTFLGLSYRTLGIAGIVLSVALSIFVYLRMRTKPGALVFSSAVLFASLFTLAHNMHERYIFPVILLICLAFVYLRDRRLYALFAAFTVSALYNAGMVYLSYPWGGSLLALPDIIVFFGSLVTVLAFGLLVYTALDIACRGNILRVQQREASAPSAAEQTEILAPPDQPRFRLTKKDHLMMWGLTLVYAVVALVNLGTANAPQTYWRTQGYSGELVTASFGETRHVSSVWVYGGIAEGDVEFATQDEASGEWLTRVNYTQIYDDMFRWMVLDADFDADEVVVRAPKSRVFFLEMAFFDENGARIPVTQAVEEAAKPAARTKVLPDSAGNHLFDEQTTVPDIPSSDNGMYFDELYHARTAYEHLHGLTPYENTHPPLGKVFIMLGVSIFGMSPFGWRIVGTLFGIAMVPCFYRFARRLFGKEIWAFVAAFVFAFDFMHFTQTRIATIDTYGVFFIILMYEAMYCFYTRSWNAVGLKKALVPLGLAGVFFALGAASKWICIYAGIGLAIILFTYLAQRMREAHVAGAMLRSAARGESQSFAYSETLNLARGEDSQQRLRSVVDNTRQNVVSTLIWCVVFFILIPVGVYLLSYIPYLACVESPYSLSGVWEVQTFMFSYHSNLTATHPFMSSWWSWPLDLRPIWYFQHQHVPEGKIGSIVAFGNPAVWWTATLGAISLIVMRLRRTIKAEKGIFIVLIGLASQYLPWVPITRATFIYHFFASVPFIILATVYVLRAIETRRPRLRFLKYVWMGVTLALFIWFYPVLSGMVVSRTFAETWKWLPNWVFFI